MMWLEYERHMHSKKKFDFMSIIVVDVRWGITRFFMKVSDSSVSCVMLELGTYVSIQSIFDMFNEKTFIFIKNIMS